jgi:hypothetical protein
MCVGNLKLTSEEREGKKQGKKEEKKRVKKKGLNKY